MVIFNLFLYLTILFVGCNLISSILILNELKRRDIKINYWLLRFLMPKYARQYKDIMLEATGQVGAVYTFWLVTIYLILISFAIVILIRFNIF